MSGHQNGHWHTANGGGLPFRPPTMDEALPYSPFTSILPFSPDIIPFPSAEPPSPPTTLTPEQQAAGKKAASILGAEIKGSLNTPRHLQQTFSELKTLLNPNELSHFQFKSATQLLTPPESPNIPTNGANLTEAPALSPFATMLLNATDISYTLPGLPSAKRSQQTRATPKQSASSHVSQPTPQPRAVSASYAVVAHNSKPPSNTPPSSVGTVSGRPGPAVLVKPLPPNSRREEYQRYEVQHSTAPVKRPVEKEAAVMKSHERELAERSTKELHSLIRKLVDEREYDESEYFQTVDTNDGEIAVLKDNALVQLSDAVSKLVNLAYFSAVALDKVLAIQSLCQPVITATSQLALALDGPDPDDLVVRLGRAEFGLRASKLMLQTMTEGSNDRRLCSEDLVKGIVQLLKQVLQSCIIPVVESRRTGSSSQIFNMAMQYKNDIHPLLRRCGNVLNQLVALIGSITLTDFTLSAIESLATTVFFTQNGEKETESALGIQRFESFRQKAMDILAQIFARHPNQRESLTIEILNNLEKLPDKRATARQFKSPRAEPIMLISALFMRMVQAATTSIPTNSMEAMQDVKGEAESQSDTDQSMKRKTAERGANKHLSQFTKDLCAASRTVATHIARMFVQRAENVSKSGDKPFRNLLDLFIEDLCKTLGSPEWPAASVLLAKLLALMVQITQNMKVKGAQAVEMAIFTMGSMGCGIIDFTSRLRKIRHALDISKSDVSSKLVPLAEEALSHNVNIKDILALDGPYRWVVESLPRYLDPQDPQVQVLSEYYVTYWTDSFYRDIEAEDADGIRSESINNLEKHLAKMAMDPQWLSKEYKFRAVTDDESQLAAGIITLQEEFCKFLQHLISILLHHTGSTSTKVKARSMASLTQMIDKDPRILNDQSFRHLAGFLTDSSPMVRENSLSLIAKCLEQNLSLDRNLLGHILNLMVDTANGPKKKAIKLSRDIYASTNDKEKRLQIATELLLPILDDDKAVVELTRQSLEDIWLGPLQPDSKLDDSQMRLNHETRLSLLVDTVQNIQGRATHLRAFEAFLTEGLSARAKNSATNLGICKDLVGDMVERVIGAEAAGQARILQTLSIFAKVESRLFTADQVQLLKLYLNNLANAEEVAVFRPTAVIFRYVFPTLPSLQEDFLGDVRQSLGKVTSSLSQFAAQGSSAYKETLLDVAHCIWTITPLLKGDPARGVGSGLDKLITFMVSILFQLLTKSLSMDKVTDDEKRQVTQRQIASLMILLGIFGKVCDFDQHVDAFRTLLSRWIHSKKFDSTEQGNRLLSWKGASVALLFLEVLLPHSKQTWDVKIREQALCSMGEICYRNPRFFMRADIGKALGLPFLNKDLSLVRVVLTQLRDYLAAAERRSESGAKIAVGDGSLHGAERMEISFVGSDSDTATTHLSRSFLPKVVDIALSQADDLALLATDIIVSISRQGLEHPKECGPALVALSTSPNAQISQRASAEHQRMHRQHESIFEKEYVVAIRMTFDYQRTVCNDPNGVNKTTSKPKMQLLFEAFKDGTRKTLKKFVTNLFRQMDFDLPSLNVTVAMSEDVLYARFCLENFALFDYARVDDVSHVILTIENIVLKKTGPSVVFAIETDLQPQQLLQQAPGSVDNPPATDSVVQDIKTPNEIKRLRQITTACMILQMMWETRTYLRKVYTLQGKITPKDMLKPATRLYFLTGKDLLERFEAMMKSLESPESMRKQCDEFVEIINIDKEHAVDDGDGEGNEHEQAARLAAGYETPEEEAGEEASAPASGRGRKRKSSAPLGNTPKKSKGRPAGSKIKKRNSKTPDGDDNWD